MSSVCAIPDSNPTRTQLRLVVLGQWVRAGLALARGAEAGRGFFGGAVALWQVMQAIRLAIQLAQRLSELSDLLSRAAPRATPAQPAALGLGLPLEEPPYNAACLRGALSELAVIIRAALGLAPDRRLAIDAAKASCAAAQPRSPQPIGLPTPPRGLPPHRPPGPER